MNKKTKRLISAILCVCICITILPVFSLAARDTSYEESLAQDLKKLGLFKGVSDTDFDLNRAPTRLEALVMLIRVLGKENEALDGSWSHPFTDVPVWTNDAANKYVGYAYEHGLTNGISATQFGLSNANAQMYLTFMLRALGYSDANGLDFTYSDPFTLSKSVGILPECVNVSDFWRADVVLVSYAALAVKMKGTSQTLGQKLISDGAISGIVFQSTYRSDAIAKYPTAPVTAELNSEQIYAKCSPAVFYIEVADKNGVPFASGSGFFLRSDGIAVTNYHVIEDAYSAAITLSTTKEQYKVAGVYDYSKEEDWAVIKIEGSGFSCLEIGDSSTVVGGAKCYAIGSPQGLQNTISDGIISNPGQVINGFTYIQTNAAISHGSSGGALINKYGQVIGITSAIMESGANLGFAIPITIISGYSSAKCTPLSELFPGYVSVSGGSTSSAAQDAYDYLGAFVQVYQNDTLAGFMAYSEAVDTSYGQVTYYLLCNPSNYDIYVQRTETVENEYYSTVLALDYFTYNHSVGYYYYSDVNNSAASLEAYSYVYAPDFRGDNLTFDEIDKNDGYDVATNEGFASSDLQDCLYFVDYIFDEYLSDFGDFGVYLFGFENYDMYS